MRICRRTGVYYGGNGLPKFSYTGTYEILDEGDRNWNVKFLTSGTLILTRDLLIDAFLVGGGASAAVGGGSMAPGCGGGGYTSTYSGITLDRNTSYSVVIGAGGAAVTVSASEGNDGGKTWIATEATYYAEGGHKGLHALSTGKVGGNGGSGGGGYQGTGGTDGGDGLPTSGWMGGYGQGTTTREFAEAAGTLYSEGGTPGGGDQASNTGNGSGYTVNSSLIPSYTAGSGICIIRNHRAA